MQKLLSNQSVRAFFCLLLASGLLGCSAESKRARSMKRAEEYFQKGEYIKAELEYRNVGKYSKNIDPKIFARFGTMYYAEGRLGEAFPFLTNAVALIPDDLDLRYQLGSIWVTWGYFDEARSQAFYILGKNPAYLKAMLLLADSARKPAEIAEAGQKLNELQRGKDSWAIHVALAELAMREKQLDVAEKEIQLAVGLDAKEPHVNMCRAKLASQRQQSKDAEQFLRIAVENAPIRSPYRLFLTQIKMEGTNFVEAKRMLEEQLKGAPDYVPAWDLLGKIALSEKDYAESARIAASVLAWAPQNYEIRLLRARTMLLQGQVTNAIGEFDRLTAAHPQIPQTFYEAAVARVRNGNTDEAIQKLDQALRVYPDYPEAVLLRANLKQRSGASEEAADSLAEFVKKRPEAVRAKLSLASAYASSGKWSEALAIYRDFIRTQPLVPEFWFLEGAALLQMKQIDKAASSFEQALMLAPTFALAAEQLVDIDLQKGDLASAQRRVDEQLKASTNGSGALMLQAKVSLAKRDWNGAEQALNSVIKANPRAVFPYALLARLHMAQGNPQKALASLRDSLQRNPTNAATFLQMGTAYESLKEYDKAKEAYAEALKINPQMGPALNNMAYLLCEQFNQPDAALPYATKAREVAPNHEESIDTLGWIYYRRGEYARALPLLKESVAKMPAQAEAHYHLAMVYYSMGDETSARGVFSRVIQLDKTFATTKGADQKLAVLDSDISDPKAAQVLEAALQKDEKDFIASLKIGQVYERAGENDKARVALERAAKLNPTSAKPLVLLASLNADKLKNLPTALEAGRAARKLAPNDPMIAGILGRILYRSRDYAAALGLLQEYAGSRAADAEALYDLGLAYYSAGQMDNARSNLRNYVSAARGARINDAKKVASLIDFQNGTGEARDVEAIASQRIQEDPNDLAGLMTLGLVAQKNQKYAEAAERFEAVIALNKTFLPAQRQLAILYAENLDNDQKAYDFGMKARQAFPTDPELALALGKVTCRRGDAQSAVRLLTEGLKQRPNDAAALYYLATAYHKLGRRAEARIELNRAVVAKLDPKLVVEANKLLDQLK